MDHIDFWNIHGGELSPHNVVRSYRIWVPLNALGAGAFASAMQAAHPENVMIVQDPRAAKRARFEVSNSAATNHKLHTCEELARAIRLYFEGRELIGDIIFDEESEQESSCNILEVLSARKYFAQDSTVEKHSSQRLHSTQKDLDQYIQFTDNGTCMFFPPSKIRDGNLCRHITTGPGGFLKRGTDLLNFLLPQYTPPRSLVCNKIRQIMDACGSMYDTRKSAEMNIEEMINIGEKTQRGELLYDPIHYSPIHSTTTHILQGDLSTYTGALDQQLCDIYPVCARLKTTYGLRIEGATHLGQAEVERVIRNMNNEMATLLSAHVDGVPNAYHMLYKESQTMIEAMTSTQPQTIEAKLMKRMVFKKRPSDSIYTTFGYRMNAISSGCKNCLLLMQKQISLFLILYARHFAVTANRVGVSGFYIVAGTFLL